MLDEVVVRGKRPGLQVAEWQMLVPWTVIFNIIAYNESQVPALAAVDFIAMPAGKAKIVAKIQKQLADHGRRSLERSFRKFERRIAEHRANIEKYREQGGFTSSMEREIRAFEAEAEVIREALKVGP